MSLNPKTSIASRNLALNAALDVCNSGFLDIYDGTQPTNVDTAITTQVKLAHLPLSATAFAAASGASKTTNTNSSAAALAGGTAAWFSFTKSDGTRVHEGSVGASGANINLNSMTIVKGAVVSSSGYTLSQAA